MLTGYIVSVIIALVIMIGLTIKNNENVKHRYTIKQRVAYISFIAVTWPVWLLMSILYKLKLVK